MNPGRIFSTPQENGVVQNGDPRIPFSPQKPVLRRPPDLVPAEMQGNQMERTDWQDLLGMYGDFLQMPASDTGAAQNPVTSVNLNKGYTGDWTDIAVGHKRSHIDINSCENVPDHSKPACTRVNSLEELIGMKNQSNMLSTSGRSSNSIHLGGIPILQNSYAQVDSRYEQPQLKSAGQSNNIHVGDIPSFQNSFSRYEQQQLKSAGQTLLNESQVFISPKQTFDCYNNRLLPLGEFTLMLLLQEHNHL